MKHYLLFLLALLLPVGAFGQTNVQTTQLQAFWKGLVVANGAQCVNVGGRPITAHAFAYSVNAGSGSVSGILVTITGSTDGGLNYSSVGTSTNVAGATIVPAAGIYTNLCITLTSITGAVTANIDASYSGAAIGSGGSVSGTITAVSATAANFLAQVSVASGGIAAGGIAASAYAVGAIRDGADTAQGTTTDNKCTTSDTTACTLVAIGKGQYAQLVALNALAVTDPCDGNAKTSVPISITTATTTLLVAASSSNKVYICSINIGPIEAVADNIALVEDASGSCASPDAGIIGGTTAAKGWNVPASGGLVLGNGSATVAKTASTNVNVCIITDSAAEVPGVLSYVLAP